MALTLPTLPELRAFEREASARLPRGELMHRAANAAAQFAWQECLSGLVKPKAAVAAGPGNNGGDAFLVALELRRRGIDAKVYAAPESFTEDAQHTRQECAAVLPILGLDELVDCAAVDCVIDGLLGIGGSDKAHTAIDTAIHRINALRDHGSWVLALDVPSGLNAFTGQPRSSGPTVRANATVTFLSMKAGLFTGKGAEYCGHAVLRTLGVPMPDSTCALLQPHDVAKVLPPVNLTRHKGDSGDVVVVGGARGMVGAAVLAARGAHAAGAGRVFVCLEEETFAADPLHPELMVRCWVNFQQPHAVLVLGCGLSQSSAAENVLLRALQADFPLIVDADALNLAAVYPQIALALSARTSPTVLTPHPLEAARLLQTTTDSVQADRIKAAHTLAQQFNAVVVLKGAGTVVADTRGTVRINPVAAPILATGGTGDLLAGCVGGLLATNMSAFDAACAGVFVHAKAGQSLATLTGGSSGFQSQMYLALLSRTLNGLRSLRA
jgi:ADP-dependent NAD(P)H-hydrate dehydratase / NAD(P)H-hydrate epimerase